MTDASKIGGSENILFILERNGEVVDVLDGRDFDYSIRKRIYGHASFSKTCMLVMKKVLDTIIVEKFDRVTAMLVCSVKVPDSTHGFYREQTKVRQVIYRRP